MKIKTLAFTIAMLFVAMEVMAQDKVRSIVVGFSPLGYNHLNVSYKDEKYKYDYKSYINAHVGFEKQFKGITSLTELTYSRAKFDHSDLTGDANPARDSDLKTWSITTYAGKTINPNKRVQFPIYLGIGADIIDAGSVGNLIFDFAAKARIKFYITDRFGIYAGGYGRFGWGAKSRSEKSSSNDDSVYTVSPSVLALEAGILIGL